MEGAAIAGGGSNVFGALLEGKAAKQSGEYNAQMAEQNAAYSTEQAEEDARRSRVLSRKTIGDMRANYGASGVTMEGSALDVLAESAANAELDALTIKHAGEVKARMFENDAAMDRYVGRMGQTASYFKAAGALASTGGKIHGAS